MKAKREFPSPLSFRSSAPRRISAARTELSEQISGLGNRDKVCRSSIETFNLLRSRIVVPLPLLLFVVVVFVVFVVNGG